MGMYMMGKGNYVLLIVGLLVCKGEVKLVVNLVFGYDGLINVKILVDLKGEYEFCLVVVLEVELIKLFFVVSEESVLFM